MVKKCCGLPKIDNYYDSTQINIKIVMVHYYDLLHRCPMVLTHTYNIDLAH